MEYIIKTKFEKGDIVYVIDRWICPILRLLVVGIAFRKNHCYSEPYVEYLCVPCDENGKVEKGFESGTYLSKQGIYAKEYMEHELYSSIDEIISRVNEIHQMTECCIDDDEKDIHQFEVFRTNENNHL